MNKLLTCVVIVFFLFSCKKEKIKLPESLSENPVFRISGNIGEEQINFIAGIDSSFVDTEIRVLNGIRQFVGQSIMGNSEFELAVSDGMIGLNPSIESIVSTNLKMNNLFDQNWFELQQSSLTNSGIIQSVDFTVNGVESSSSLNIYSTGYHSICANVKFADGTVRTICNNLLLGYVDYAKFNITREVIGGATLLSIVTDNDPIKSIKWYANQNLIAESQTVQLDATIGLAIVRAEVTFQNGITRERTILVDMEQGTRNFDDISVYQTSGLEDFMNDFNLSMEYRTSQNHYRSFTAPGYPSTIQINEFSLYKELSNGNKIYKVSVTINTNFVNLATNQKYPSQLKIVTALELPY